MKRSFLGLLAAVAAVCALPTAASADIQVGVTATPVTVPTCPAGVSQQDCLIVLTQVTAFETLRDSVVNPTTITQPGSISEFTIGAAALSSADVTYLDSSFGSPPEVQLTVLRPIGRPGQERWQVAAQSQVIDIQDYLGSVTLFPVQTELPVVRGEVLALTVPTWAPVLNFDLSTSAFSYRQSRAANCTTSSSANLAQVGIGEFASYGCNYAGTRVEYSATEIPTPSSSSTRRTKHQRKSERRKKHSRRK